MEIITWLLSVLKTVPVWVWVIAVICIVAPTLSYALKKSVKVIGVVCLVAVCLFVFPSIGTAFMDTAGLKYDPTTNQLTNSAGQTITIKLPDLEGVTDENATETVQDIIGKAQKIFKSIDTDALKNGEINVEDVKTKAAELFGEYLSDEEAQTIMKILNFTVEDGE